MKMGIEYNIILGALVFVVATYIIVRILSNHWFQKPIALGIYFLAIIPNLSELSSGVLTLEQGIMAFFDSIYIYILFSVYLGTIVALRILKSDWFAKSVKMKGEKREVLFGAAHDQSSLEERVKSVMKKIKSDLNVFEK